MHARYGPLLQPALAEWSNERVYLGLDTSMCWNTYGLVRVSLVERGRALPLVWSMLEHPSSRVASDVDQELLAKVAEVRPVGCTVVLTADRGCADTHLMAPLPRLRWPGRMRINGSVWVYRPGQRRCQVNRGPGAVGKALCWPHVYLTQPWYGPLPLALGRPQESQESWLVVSDEPTAAKTCAESGWRLDIAAHFLDDTSHGVQLASSLIRSVHAFARRWGVLAITTLSRVAHGTEVVAHGKRRWVAAPWFRGQSALKSGWRWVQLALSRGDELTTRLHVAAEADPEPAMASNIQHQNRSPLFFAVEYQDAVA